MPESFEKCLNTPGHRVRTKQLSDNRYIRICYIGNKSYAGEAHEKVGEKLKKALAGR